MRLQRYNLSIILTALLSLKYYYESIESRNEVESVLLVDELDATLHPHFQFKILSLFEKMSKDYKIQIVFTTHSLSLIERALTDKDNVIYLIDNINSVHQMDNPDIQKVRLHLYNISVNSLYSSTAIPVFSEDDEARVLLNSLFDDYQKKNASFRIVRTCFHLVNACLGAESLTNIFKDFKLSEIRDRSICILDGDHNTDLSNLIISLPGNKSPEEMIFDYLEILFETDDFWNNNEIISRGYSKRFYLENIKDKINDFNDEQEHKKARGESTKGDRREFNKKLFNDNIDFLRYVMVYWINDSDNKKDIDAFFVSLKIAYRRVASFYQLSPNEWKDDE